MQGALLAIHVGTPRIHLSDRGTWRSAIVKDPVSGPVRLEPLGLEGDAVADTKNHGGLDNAVLIYGAGNYDLWRQDGRDYPFSGFGENFVVSGMDETTVCVGDTFAIGDEVRVQVTQARVPCENLNLRWNDPNLMREVLRTLRSGWYIRVLKTGTVEAGMTVNLVERPHPDWPLVRASRIRYGHTPEREEAVKLAEISELSERWRSWVERKLATTVSI